MNPKVDNPSVRSGAVEVSVNYSSRSVAKSGESDPSSFITSGMKVIIAGSRDIYSRKLVARAVEESGFEVTEVVSGRCRGVDTVGEEWAKERGIPVKPFPAKWYKDGKLDLSAGPVRNSQMAEYADALVAIPRRNSRGTADMVAKMKAAGKPVYEKRL